MNTTMMKWLLNLFVFTILLALLTCRLTVNLHAEFQWKTWTAFRVAFVCSIPPASVLWMVTLGILRVASAIGARIAPHPVLWNWINECISDTADITVEVIAAACEGCLFIVSMIVCITIFSVMMWRLYL